MGVASVLGGVACAGRAASGGGAGKGRSPPACTEVRLRALKRGELTCEIGFVKHLPVVGGAEAGDL